MHTYIICIGSNYNRKENLFLARKQLRVLFPGIRFATEQETKPFQLTNPALFSNQVALFTTDADIDIVRHQMKEIESNSGRKPVDKEKEIVVLDIDIILYDDNILKEQDMARDYIIQGIKEISQTG